MRNPDDVRAWLAAKLDSAPRGTKSRLARYLRVSPDAVSRMLANADGKESRAIKGHELIAMQAFFAEIEAQPPRQSADEVTRAEMLAVYDDLPADLKRVFLAQLDALASLTRPEPSPTGGLPEDPDSPQL